MQAGFARTGHKFGFEYYNVKPDLICCGKGMGGGFPLSGLIGRKKLLDLPGVGDMSSTHSVATPHDLMDIYSYFPDLVGGRIWQTCESNLTHKY